MSAIELKQVSKTFSHMEVIHAVDINIGEGEFCVLVGPSGCGKSTLLRLIAGLEPVTSGTLLIDGRRVNDLPPAARGIAMVFQSYALYPHMTVYRNMAFGLKMARNGRAEIDRRVREAANILQLEPLLGRRPAQLSGGQRQRVAIGRAIVRDPKVFLLDEPLSNLDAALRVQTRLEIARLHQRLGNTIVYVTHDQVEAMTLADRIVVLNDGHVEQAGNPLDLYRHPRNRFVAGFLGSPRMNFLTCRSAATDRQDVSLTLPGGSHVRLPFRNSGPGPVILGLRPEHIHPGAAGELVLHGSIDLVECLGEVSYLYLTLADGSRLIVSRPGITRSRAGEHIEVSAAATAAHVFDSRGNALPRALKDPHARNQQHRHLLAPAWHGHHRDSL